jgi:tetrapyrrole methylase family protein / MazG family protein
LSSDYFISRDEDSLSMLPYLHAEPKSETEWFEALIALARYLRTPDGCPWDREQTTADFAKFAVEEAAEFRDACAGTDAAEIREEFGDAFFVLLAAAAAAEEEGLFTLKDAFAHAHEKMVRRHDHVFGENKAATPEEATAAWNRVKADEKRGTD